MGRKLSAPETLVNVTTTQRALLSAVTGDVVYDTTVGMAMIYLSGSWHPISIDTVGAIGSIEAYGHSYLAGANFSNTGTDYMEEVGMLAALAGLLGVSNENIIHHGIAGTLLSSPTSGFNATLGGWAGILQLSNPNNATHTTTNAKVFPAVPRCQPGLGLLVFGVNELASSFLEWDLPVVGGTSNGRNAWSQALRAAISRLRAGCLWCSKAPAGSITWDSTIAFNGGHWSDVARVNNTAAGVKKTSTNGDSVVITLPADLLPGTYGFCFIGQQNAFTTLSGAMTNVQTTLPATAFASFPASGTYVATIESDGTHAAEDVLITANAGTLTWTVTRGVNGTSAVAHNSGSTVRMSRATGNVAWTTNGSNAAITGTTQLGGQGYFGAEVAVVKRFVLTAADAGKTITATVGGIVTGDTSFPLLFDSWWMESPEPRPVIVMNIPRYVNSAIVGANMTTMNSDTASVVAEFDGAVQIADVDSLIWNHSFTANGATGTGTTVAVTANDATTAAAMAATSPFKPFKVCNGGVETWWCTAMASTGGANYNLTVTRAYDLGSATSKASGTWLSWGELFAVDGIHPSAWGHPAFASVVLAAIQNLTLTPTQQARAAGNWTQNAKTPMFDPADTNYLMPPINALPTAVAIATGLVTWVPVWIPKECTITEIGCAVTAFNASSTIALGIYDSDQSNQRPGAKLYDCGTISGNTPNGLKTITGLACRHRGGWIWLAFLQTGTAATVRAVAEAGLGGFLPQTVPSATYSPVIGYSKAGQSTLPTSASGITEVAGTASTTNTVAMMHVKARNTQFL